MSRNTTISASVDAVDRAPSRVIRSPRTDYTPAFREQAVQLVLRDGKGLTSAARELDVNVKTYANWVKQARTDGVQSLQRIDSHRVNPVSELQSEISRLRRALAQVSEERDILKKATAYFARIAK